MNSFGSNAADFELGDFNIRFDSIFSAGASYRIEDRDWSLIGKSNNQTFVWDGYKAYAPQYGYPQVWNSFGSHSTNGDLGNLNYDPGQAFSQVVKGLHDLSIDGDGYGAFVRFMYFKDFAVEGIGYTDPVSGETFDPCKDDEAKELACQDFRFLDMYVYADFEFGNMPVSIKVGEQVLSWGESTLISHGINVGAVDLARLYAPGSDLKEAFIPTGMVWANIGLTDTLSLEGFYQYEWQETRLPVAGTYFATNDFVSAGGHLNGVQLNFAGNPDMNTAELVKQLNEVGQMVAADPANAANVAPAYLAYPTKYAVRATDLDQEAKDSGQFGLKLGWFAEDLNYTEFGFYYINYHSRRPLISGIASDFSTAKVTEDLLMLGTQGVTADTLSSLNAFTKAAVYYPEDIKLYGFSFNTTIGTTAVSGEISHRQDEPIQIDDAELLFAAMPEQLANAGIRPEIAGISQIGDNAIEGCDLPLGGVQLGQEAGGFCLVDTTQAQFTLIQSFGPTLGLDNLAAVFEAGYVMIHDFPDHDVLRFNAPGTDRSGTTTLPGGVVAGVQNGYDEDPHFPTEDAWGYRLILAGELNNVFGTMNVKPKVVFSHDVEGITPDPMFLFHEDKKSMSAGFDVQFQDVSVGFSYNSYWDGVGRVNQLSDRDFVSFNIKYSL
jgi:hypothetical protein